MSVLKSEVKLLAIGDVGSRIEDRLETAKNDVHAAKGAAVMAGKIAEDIQALTKFVDEDLDKGVFDLEVAKKLKQYVGRAAQIAENHRLQKTTLS